MERCFFTHYVQQSMALKTKDDRIPQSFSEACKIPAWANAIDREYDALVERGTWKYLDRTPDMDPLPFTCNFRVKDTSSGDRMLYKARCCLCGNLQKTYRDFNLDALYAPVVRHESIRVFLAKVAAQNLLERAQKLTMHTSMGTWISRL